MYYEYCSSTTFKMNIVRNIKNIKNRDDIRIINSFLFQFTSKSEFYSIGFEEETIKRHHLYRSNVKAYKIKRSLQKRSYYYTILRFPVNHSFWNSSFVNLMISMDKSTIIVARTRDIATRDRSITASRN